MCRKASTEGICTSSAVCFLAFRTGSQAACPEKGLETFPRRDAQGRCIGKTASGKTATGKYCRQYFPERFRCAPGTRSGKSLRKKVPEYPAGTPSVTLSRKTASRLCDKVTRTYREYEVMATTALLQINDKAWKEYSWVKNTVHLQNVKKCFCTERIGVCSCVFSNELFFHASAFFENVRRRAGQIFAKCVRASLFLLQAYLPSKFLYAETQYSCRDLSCVFHVFCDGREFWLILVAFWNKESYYFHIYSIKRPYIYAVNVHIYKYFFVTSIVNISENISVLC